MNNSVAANPPVPFLDLFNFNFSATQPTQDADAIEQLPFIPGLKEFLMLRQVHALEHATVWVLSEFESKYSNISGFTTPLVDNELLSGLSTERGFYLYGQVNKIDLQRAVRVALQRLTHGESHLAVHPRCGTNVSVAMLLTFGLGLGMHLLLPRTPIEQILGWGMAATTAAQLAPELGVLAQRYITTAIPFNLEIADIKLTQDSWGRTAYFIKVGWRDSPHASCQV
jgi:hypothetical protein